MSKDEIGLDDFSEHEKQKIQEYHSVAEEKVDLRELFKLLDPIDLEGFFRNIDLGDEATKEEMLAFIIKFQESVYKEGANTSYTFERQSKNHLKILKDTLDSEGNYLFTQFIDVLCDKFGNSNIKGADSVLSQFSHSKKYMNIKRNRKKLRSEIPEEMPIELDPKYSDVERARKIHELSAKLFDSSLFLVYILYKIRENKKPNIEDIKNNYSTSIKREILNSDIDLFDSFIQEFDSTLRNGLMHGDYSYDPIEKKLSIDNASYTINELQESINRSLRVSLILSNIRTINAYIYSKLVSQIEGFELIHSESKCPECKSEDLFAIEPDYNACLDCGHYWS